MKKILLLGAGPFNIVLANQLSQCRNLKLTIIEKRSHIAGNCYTKRDSETNVMIHEYGPHIFNTNHLDVWEFVNRFGEIKNFINRVKAITPRGVFSLPINLLTLNSFFGTTLNPFEAKKLVDRIRDKKIKEPKNFEEAALSSIGKDLYNNFILGYTYKQWGIHPSKLPASIFKRLPIRFDYNDSYYNTDYQGIPAEGYTKLFANMLEKKQVNVVLNEKFHQKMLNKFDHVFFSGAIDNFFNYKYGFLGYRTVLFDKIIKKGDIQGNAVINYTALNIPFTRIHEHKHFTPWEKHDFSTALREKSKQTEKNEEPYYPIRTQEDCLRYKLYENEAKKIKNKVTFVGRLGFYKYLDMDQVIGTALDFAKTIQKKNRFNISVKIRTK